ncbi:MAG: LysM peptidoglycan-binding domain-containing protein [Dehalococcoidia bacterium]|nr:LysM peptidoglycan-binding domain-containing protein [Dehalococcoidia bacterium]
MRIRVFTILLVTAAITLTACGGEGGEATPQSGGATAIPTATPFATLPEPTIVTGPGGTVGGPVASDVTYVVEPGDAVSTIAERYGVPADVIREANGITNDEILVGQVLRIPRSTGGSAATPTPTSTPSTGTPGTYTVQPGDTAFGIALQFDVTLEDLETANGVGPGGLDDLSLGQVLQIPQP